MRALSQRLNADGYVNLCISKDSLSTLYGIRYIPREMKWENAIRRIEKVTELSVLIIEGLGKVHTKEANISFGFQRKRTSNTWRRFIRT